MSVLQHSAVWQQELGDPPLAMTVRRAPVPLLLLLHRLAEAGHLAPEMVLPAERLAASLELPASAHGNFAGALITLAAAARQRRMTLRAAAAAVRGVGGTVSLGKLGILLRRLREGWEVGGRAWCYCWRLSITTSSVRHPVPACIICVVFPLSNLDGYRNSS